MLVRTTLAAVLILGSYPVFASNSDSDLALYKKAIAEKSLPKLQSLVEKGFSVFEDRRYDDPARYYPSYPIVFMIMDGLDKDFALAAFQYILTLPSCPAFFAMNNGNVDSYFSGQLLVYAFHKKSKPMVDLILELFPDALLKNIGAPRGGRQPPPAIAEAVQTDNFDMVTYMVTKKGFPKDYVYLLGSLGLNENLLTWSRSSPMDALLIGLGVPQTVPLGKWKGTCADDNVRIRESYGLDSKVIGKIDKGESILAVERTAKSYSIDGKQSCWLKIVTGDGTAGWSFGAFYTFDFGL
jgi:hypothetical protein